MSPDSVYLAKAMRESAAQFENEQREIERAIEQTRLAREQERAAEEEAAKRLAAEREDARAAPKRRMRRKRMKRKKKMSPWTTSRCDAR
jgi:hypothetical protein